MSINYRIKTIATSEGERLPILLGSDGLPLFELTVFALSQLRSTNKASNTIDSYLRSCMVLLLFLNLKRIDLSSRLNEGQIFFLGEIEDLVRICRLPLKKIYSILNEAAVQAKQAIIAAQKTLLLYATPWLFDGRFACIEIFSEE